jgi:ABC-2 type transport system permease protein
MNLAEPGFRPPGMWASVWKLLRLRLIITVNSFRRARTRTKVAYIIAALGLLIFLGFILFISIALLSFLRSPQLSAYIGDTNAFLESIPAMLVSISAVGILVTGFGVLLQALYLSGDMDFLMSAPIPIRAVFIAKLVQALLPNFGIMCLFTLPILFGLGFSAGYQFLYYPLVVIVLVLITLAAASLASLLVMVAARYFPARRMAEVMGFVVGTFFLVFSQSARFMNFDVNNQQVTNLLNLTGRFNQPWSPLAWAGHGLVYLGQGNWLPAAGLLAAALVLTGGIFYVALSTSERLYYTGWSSLQNNRRKQKTRASAPERKAAPVQGTGFLTNLIPAPVRAIMVKDLLVYRRDLRNMSQLITPLILGVVYAVGLLRDRGEPLIGRGDAPAWVLNSINGVMVYADVALALFLGWMLAARLAGLGFSHEGKNYWMLKAAPVSSRQLLTAKFLTGYLPSLVVCSVYVLILQILKGAGPLSVIISLAAVALTLAGINGIYLAFGTRGAKFDWETPQQMGGAVGCLGTLAGMLFVPVCFGLFIVPPLLAGFFNFPLLLGQLVGLLLGGAASLAAAIIPLGWAEKRVASLGEA